MNDTIFALSSGRPPAAIAVVRISGPRARDALMALIGRVPPPRQAALVHVRDPQSGEVIDILIKPNLDQRAAERFLRLLCGHGRTVAQS